MSIVVITTPKGKTMYVSNHPISRRNRIKFTPNRDRAHEFTSGASARNIRDSLLQGNNVTLFNT